MIERYFPTFKVVEINKLTGRIAGHDLAQFPAAVGDVAHKTVGDYTFLENGVIVGLNKEGKIVNYKAADCAQPCLVANDEQVGNIVSGLKYFAQEFEDGTAYPLAYPLYVGDSFVTDNFAGTASSATNAKVVDGVLTLQAAADADTLFVVKAKALPAGQAAFQFTYVGKVVNA